MYKYCFLLFDKNKTFKIKELKECRKWSCLQWEKTNVWWTHSKFASIVIKFENDSKDLAPSIMYCRSRRFAADDAEKCFFVPILSPKVAALYKIYCL